MFLIQHLLIEKRFGQAMTRDPGDPTFYSNFNRKVCPRTVRKMSGTGWLSTL